MRRITSLAAGTLVLLAACSSEPQTVPGGSINSNPGTDDTGSEVIQAQPKELNLDEPLVLVDGWSVVNLDGALTYQDADGKDRKTKLAPLSPQQVQEVTSKYPDLMEKVLTYTVTFSKAITCESGKCTLPTASGSEEEIDLTLISNPDQIETLGEVYKATGITDLLWAAQEEDISEVNGLRVDTPPLLLAAGLGRVFENNPEWLTSRGSGLVRFTEDLAFTEDVEETLREATVGTALRGLGDEWEGATYLTSSWLTATTSPAVGCPGVLCTAGVSTGADKSVKVSEEKIKVCAETPDGEPRQAGGVVVTTEGTVNVPRSANQQGASGVKADTYGYPTAAELVQGETPWNNKTVYLLEPNGKPIWFAGANEITGTLEAENLDYTAQDILDEFAVYKWEVCG